MMTASDAVAPSPFPHRVGGYDVLVPIARGGMATVYLGRDPAGENVAIKLMHEHLRERPDFAKELVEEGKLASLIEHPNVVRLREVGDGDELFLVMDYIEGDTLANLESRSPGAGLPLGIGLRILFDALAGLHAAHNLCDASGKLVNLVHRDFSPQNILVGVDGVSRLADFGVAKAATRASFTRTGLVKGKLAYMAPEQARGEALDRRCDIWAAGVIAWEILAGRSLYEGIENEAVLLLQLVTDEPPRLAEVRSDVPRELDDVVASALHLDRAARCPSAGTLLTELKAACGSAGMRVATRRDVGEHVAALLGARIEARREKADRVMVARREIEAAPTTTVSSQHERTPPSLAASTLLEAAPAPSPSRRGRSVAAAAAVVAVVAGAVWSASRLTSRPAAATAPIEATSASSPELEPSSQPVAITPAPSAEAASSAPPKTEASHAAPTPSSTPRRAGRAPATAHPKGAPPLAQSPYAPEH